MNSLFSSWKYKIEQFKLLMQLKHNQCGFTWNEQNLSTQNNELLDKLDFLKLDKPPSNPRAKKVNPKVFKLDEKNVSAKEKESSNKNNKKASKSRKTEKPKLTVINKNSFKQQISAFEQQIKQTIAPPLQTQIQLQPVNQIELAGKVLRASDIIKFNEDSTINLICNNEELTATVDPNKVVNGLHSHTQLQIQPEITTANNCTYFNLLSVSYAPTNYYHQNDLNVSQMVVESNVDASVEELLNCNENGISIENDKFIYF